MGSPAGGIDTIYWEGTGAGLVLREQEVEMLWGGAILVGIWEVDKSEVGFGISNSLSSSKDAWFYYIFKISCGLPRIEVMFSYKT